MGHLQISWAYFSIHGGTILHITNLSMCMVGGLKTGTVQCVWWVGLRLVWYSSVCMVGGLKTGTVQYTR